ncbi:MAG: hypothetical protein BEN19_02315 [Epulopiscium sp. Nuni2H_MBin003]|nr:MAG: hypothetical protein BEN19_02315 [Epulopiscium sp. Nuni2H_MBin003]
MNKKLLLTLLVMTTQISGCSTQKAGGNIDIILDRPLNILCSTYPVYEWTKSIVGDIGTIELLMDNGVDPHNYQATADDLIQMQTSDLIIYIGGDSESWITDVIDNNSDIQYINLMASLDKYTKDEEIIEGMEHNHDEHDHSSCSHSHVQDEHIWLSVKLAKEACNVISDAISTIDTTNVQTYSINLASYIEELDKLDNKYEQVVDNSDMDIIIFGDRFPFRYLLDDYDINYYAAFTGCSTDTEASFETIVFLAEKLDEEMVSSISYVSDSNKKIAETIVSSSQDDNREFIQFNSMEIVDHTDSSISYISIMEDNLASLEMALGR